MIKNIINDAKVCVSIFKDMQKVRKQGGDVALEKKVQIPFIRCGGFYNTVEGCTLSHLDREIVFRAQEAFAGLADDEKYRLQFSPKNGEFIERARYWKGILKPVMTEKQCLVAMNCIIGWYIHIKKMQLKEDSAV